jgi:hypothetical protein
VIDRERGVLDPEALAEPVLEVAADRVAVISRTHQDVGAATRMEAMASALARPPPCSTGRCSRFRSPSVS